ncbi:DNA repair protein RecO [Acholeplasma sp. OttesenSCG-928-E16]|nr:DNA repair protein RecO [Acholeplasma sp. OttesenSCG-928-E16]
MEGIIYKVQNYQENSKLVFVYTKSGKRTLVASGALKMNSNLRIMTQFLNHISFEESKKMMFNLKNCELINDFSTIKNNYQLTKNSSTMLEVIDKLIYEDNEHEKIFNELILALNNNIETSYLTFLARILFYLGFAPNIKGNGKKVKGMSVEKGGIVYEDEYIALDLDYQETILFLRLISGYQTKLDLSNDVLEKLIYFLIKYYQYHLQISLKTLK